MRAGLLCLAALVAAGCGTDQRNPPFVMDSAGVTFLWDCSDNPVCDLEQLDDVFLPFDPTCEIGVWGRQWGRFYDVCAACAVPDISGWVTAGGRCRSLACEIDAECPVVQGRQLDRYECVDGLCQNRDVGRFPRDEWTRRTAEAVCFRDVPRAESYFVSSRPDFASGEAVEIWDALDASCPGRDQSCSLPALCGGP